MLSPTPHNDVNILLDDLLTSVQDILGRQLVGAYLFGSLANGGFDEDSDIDVLMVTRKAIDDDQFAELSAMHDRLFAIDSPWAIQLEVSYIPVRALRRYDPTDNVHPHVDRGYEERLHRMVHDEAWLVQRHVLRQRGITLLGPPPETLIDPVTPDQLREAMRNHLRDWTSHLLAEPDAFARRGGQSYTVLSLCRILYTIDHGDVVSKQVAAHWAQRTLDPCWTSLIEGVWHGRHHPNEKAATKDVQATIAFIHYALEHATRP